MCELLRWWYPVLLLRRSHLKLLETLQMQTVCRARHRPCRLETRHTTQTHHSHITEYSANLHAWMLTLKPLHVPPPPAQYSHAAGGAGVASRPVSSFLRQRAAGEAPSSNASYCFVAQPCPRHPLLLLVRFQTQRIQLNFNVQRFGTYL